MSVSDHVERCRQRFGETLEEALDKLQESRGLAGWPDAGARFMLEHVRVDFQPSIPLYSFTAIAAIVSPVNKELKRIHARTVSEVFALESISLEEEDMRTLSPYFRACGEVLTYRVGRVLSERFG